VDWHSWKEDFLALRLFLACDADSVLCFFINISITARYYSQQLASSPYEAAQKA